MDDIKKQLEQLSQEFNAALKQVTSSTDLEGIRLSYLARQGSISNLMHVIKDLSVDERRELGPLLNTFKNEAQTAFQSKHDQLEAKKLELNALKQAHFDVTAYQPGTLKGSLHPYTHTQRIIEDIFITMGFEIADGPEVETEYHNFDALNIPADHPARDMQDTFWLTLPGLLMRTHTSTVQIHKMLTQKPPIAIVVPGRAFRNEATDATHDFMFMQMEGLFVGKNVSVAHLLATVKQFLQGFFEKNDLDVRMRPGYFPFVEPGIEFDMTCPFCKHGCSVCKKTGWIEICGSGLVHPNVLHSCGLNSNEYSAFAFGFGLTRLVMLKYGINDIRLLHSSRIDFLKQF